MVILKSQQHLDHEWAVKFIESRIKDPNIIRLVRRMLKAGVMKDFQYEETEAGSGQGLICSPTIANIYMHYVLLWWFHEVVQLLIIQKLNQIFVGYYHFYGITDNFRAIESFRYRVERSLFYWLNRRSQKISYTWSAFSDMLKVYPLARPRIYVSIYG